MILYTPIPSEMIFPEDDSYYAKQQTIEIEGGMLVVQPISEGEYKVVRLISSDLSLYLKEKYSPGQTIMVSLQI